MPRKGDFFLLVIPVILSLIGLLFIYSAGGQSYFIRQAIWLAISIVAFILASRFSPRFFHEVSIPFYLLCLGLLILTLLFSTRSPRRWLDFGSFSFQPSEIAKVAVVLMMAHYLAAQKLRGTKETAITFGIALFPAILILFEPNLGSSVIFLLLPFIILYGSGVPILTLFLILSPLLSIIFSFSIFLWAPYIVLLTLFLIRKKPPLTILTTVLANSIVGLFTPLLWQGLQEYQRQRIIGFLAPWIDPKGIGWQTIQSRIAFGSGGLWGKGLFAGTQKKLAFLPAAHTDFIVSVIGEEFGFLGIFFIATLYLILSMRIISLARETKSPFATLTVLGILGYFIYHWFVNIGVAVGILPVTGLPLPFISYGGSSLLSLFLAMGILFTISYHRFER